MFIKRLVLHDISCSITRSLLSRHDRLNKKVLGHHEQFAMFFMATALFTSCQRQQSLIKMNTLIKLIKAVNLGKSTQASHLINQPLQSCLVLAKSESSPCCFYFHLHIHGRETDSRRCCQLGFNILLLPGQQSQYLSLLTLPQPAFKT